MSYTEPACEIRRYLHQRPGRSSWWFRRRVPRELISVIGQQEWRYTLKARNRDDATTEAIPHLAETNQTIELARRGDWPPMTSEQAAALAKKWNAWCPMEAEDRSVLGDPMFYSGAEFLASVDQFLAEYAPRVRRETTAYECFTDHARTKCMIRDSNHGFRYAGLPLKWTPFGKIVAEQAAAREIVIFDPDPENTRDLVALWAEWRKKPDKTKYQVRAMMGRLVEITKINDLAKLSRQHVEDWIKHLRENEKNKQGKPLSDTTIAANFDFLRILSNFAIEKEWIAENPSARLKIVKRGKNKRTRRSYTEAEARVVLEWARQQATPYLRWLPWVCCFTGCRLEEVAGAMVKDIEKIGPYWVLNVRLDHRSDDATLKTEEAERRVPLHPALIAEGFVPYVQTLKSRDGSLFPELRPDRFGSKGGTATKRIGPRIRQLASIMPSLADIRLSPSHSWRHRLHDEFRRVKARQDIEDAIIGHASEGSGTGYGEYAIIDMLGPAIEKTRSPLDVDG